MSKLLFYKEIRISSSTSLLSISGLVIVSGIYP